MAGPQPSTQERRDPEKARSQKNEGARLRRMHDDGIPIERKTQEARGRELRGTGRCG